MKFLQPSRKKGSVLAAILFGLLALPVMVLMGFGPFNDDGMDYSDCAVTVQMLDPVKPGEQSSNAHEPVCYKTRADYLEAYPEREAMLDGDHRTEDTQGGKDSAGEPPE